MICVAENYSGVELRLEPLEANPFYRALGANGHENWGLDIGTPGSKNTGPCLAITSGHAPIYSLHKTRSTGLGAELPSKMEGSSAPRITAAVPFLYFGVLSQLRELYLPISAQIFSAPTAVSVTIRPFSSITTADGVPDIPRFSAVLRPKSITIGDFKPIDM